MTLPGVHRFSREAMATTFQVRCAHPDAAYAGQAAEAAFQLVAALEQEQSRFIPNSDVSRINELSEGEATRVAPSTMECLEIARRMYDATAGAFDVSVGSGLADLDLLPDEGLVRARRPGVRLDLGGIAKGYAVDRMAELLVEWEVPRALIHGGWSSVRALEPPPAAAGWDLTLSTPEPQDREVLARLAARRRALSASGTGKGEHILDPRSGRSAPRRAVWVALATADDPSGSPAAVAETLSTALMVLSMAEIEDLLRRGAGVEAWILEGDRMVHFHPGRDGP